MQLANELQKIGLTDKEARVYLSSLELGQASVQNIAKESGVNRATTYIILEALKEKGLVSSYEHGKKAFFVATSPDQLDSVFEIKKKDLEEKEKNFKRLLPQLRMIQNKKVDKPVIRFFDGRQGLLNCMEEFMADSAKAESEPLRMVYSQDRLSNLFTEEERKKFKEIRLQKKVQTKVIYSYEKGEKQSSPDGMRVNLIDKDFPITCDLAIYGDTFRISSLGKDLSAVLIKDVEIAKTMKTIFELAWESALRRYIETKRKQKEL
ncbi:MAG: helix-turn-helix domain-containing protein [Patescibacteria group bacterium]